MPRFIIFCLLCMCAIGSHGFQNSVIIADGPMSIDLKKSMQWQLADHSSLSLGQLQLQFKQQDQFQALGPRPLLQANHTYWLRLHVINPMATSIPLSLQLSNTTLTLEGAYTFDKDKWQRLAGQNNRHQLFAQQGMMINFAPHSSQWLYIRVRSTQSSELTPKLQDLSHYADSLAKIQQIHGATFALVLFIILLHGFILRFHHRSQHYFVMVAALIVGVYNLSQSPLGQWPQWLINMSYLTPWIFSCGLWLSSRPQKAHKHNLLWILASVLVALILVTLNHQALLLASLSVALFALSNLKKTHLLLNLSSAVLVINLSWQLLYSFAHNWLPAPDNLSITYTLNLCLLLVSASIISPYFRRQISKKKTANQGMQSNFLSKLSHELRTPMNGVLGMSELLSQTPLSNTQRDYLDTINVSGHDMLRLINRMSDYAKLSMDRLQLEDRTIDISDLLESSLNKFQNHAEHKNIELVLNLAANLPQQVALDASRLETILENLLENALRHCEHGEVEVRLSLHEKNNDALFFSIRNTGRGLDKPLLKVINQDSRKLELTDELLQQEFFNLVLSKRLCEAMAGHFYVESNLSLGSTISFSLPFRHGQSAAQPAGLDILKGLSILIVDDNSTLRKVIQRYAKSWGMQADATYSGKEALAMLRSQANIGQAYDIILIDQDMPIMDGFQLAKHIQGDDSINSKLLKIMLTGLGINSGHKEVLNSGIHQVLNKPISARALQQTLALHMRQRRHHTTQIKKA